MFTNAIKANLSYSSGATIAGDRAARSDWTIGLEPEWEGDHGPTRHDVHKPSGIQ
jgi:hypothetical protein